MTLPALIDKQDNCEIIRDKVVMILSEESVSQVALATTAAKPNPNDWKLRVFKERSNPWDNLDASDTSPVVNVWWDTSTFQMSQSNIAERQKSVMQLNIDCSGYAQSSNTVEGHTPGDEGSALVVQRAVRLIRNILMAAEYCYLGLRGTVWRRWVESITMMEPQRDNQNVKQIICARLTLKVEFNEFSPQVASQELEIVSTEVSRAEDDQVVITANYDYTE